MPSVLFSVRAKKLTSVNFGALIGPEMLQKEFLFPEKYDTPAEVALILSVLECQEGREQLLSFNSS